MNGQLPEVTLTKGDVLLLFGAAIEREDLERADALASVLLAENDSEVEDA